MKNSNAPDQHNTQTLDIDFNHRLAWGGDNNESSYARENELIDSIGLITDRAISILLLLSTQFDREVSRINDDQIFNAIDTVIHEVQDIKNLSSAYSKARRANIEKGGV